MDIRRDGRFFMSHSPSCEKSLGIESDRLRECVEEIGASRLRGVFGSPCFGFREDHVDFLSELPWVTHVWFWDVSIRRIEGLYALRRLRSFGVHSERPGIDFARFPELESVTWMPRPGDRGMEALRGVRRMDVSHYNPRARSFLGLAVPASVVELSISWANPSDLRGLPQLPDARRVWISRCRNLRSLDALPDLVPNVEHLVVNACGRVSSAAAASIVARLPNVRHAWVQDRLLVSAHGSQDAEPSPRTSPG